MRPSFRWVKSLEEERFPFTTRVRFSCLVPSWNNVPVQEEESWPPYKLNENHFLAKTLFETAIDFFNEKPNYKISGPSNIGNYLSQNEIPAISGYGVKYENIYALDEKIYINDIETIYQVYLSVVKKLLN